jgi:hypothetical protein
MSAMVGPEGLEPPTYWFVASRSIQLSYGPSFPGFNKLKTALSRADVESSTSYPECQRNPYKQRLL